MEHPLAAVLQQDKLSSNCSNCFAAVISGHACDTCTQVFALWVSETRLVIGQLLPVARLIETEKNPHSLTLGDILL